ncbi:DUF1499 domain-containing protein [Primorskyibacter flagellatus]|uniref:DUF1499 domain-containing protein n=1 Tax=Primorskyibacter flagellatus TaxID=1387277 RepID=A0A1W2D704_9RHOB|nr:DUF1499 domain-containing protein [Primorskyibacter flagellatus]SMC92996.1 Protein of unknown function [Primorskyibacter flagellatus]
MKTAALIVLVLVIALMVYIRLAPSDAARWHVPLGFDTDETLTGGARRIIPGDAETLAKLDEIARTTPRTKVLAGSVAGGHITYVTRSAGFGFPDYTTVQLVNGQIRILARLRFGKADFGVNAARVDDWLQALSQT